MFCVCQSFNEEVTYLLKDFSLKFRLSKLATREFSTDVISSIHCPPPHFQSLPSSTCLVHPTPAAADVVQTVVSPIATSSLLLNILRRDVGYASFIHGVK